MRRNFNINKINEQFHELPKYKKDALNKEALRLFGLKKLSQQRQTTPESMISLVNKIRGCG